MIRKYLLVILFMAGADVFAQEAAPAVREVPSSSNMLAIMMLVIALVFAFVIYAMGQVLITLSREVLQKQKSLKTIFTLLLVTAASIKSTVLHAQDAAAEEIVKVVPNYGGLSATAFWSFVVVIAAEVVTIAVILYFIKRMQEELLPGKATTKKTEPWKVWWERFDKKFFTKAVPVAHEEDILLHHDYDGIKELDNSLPPWWKYGFILTIVFSVVYLLNFHVLGTGKNPAEEYQAAMQKAREQQEIYDAKNKDKVDESHLEMSPAAGVAEGKEVFEQVCWACHGKAGEGGAGPNLTDDYWLHKGSLTDIYHSIKTGYPDKGMQAWGKMYSQKQIANIASYVKSLHGTKPLNAKAPQGEIYTEAPEPIKIKDSGNVVKDTIPAT